MSTYTFILEFRGGTYISQFKGKSVEQATQNWSTGVNTKAIQHLKKKWLIQVGEDLEEDGVVAINEVTNVWCHTFSIKGKLALLNIVKTELD